MNVNVGLMLKGIGGQLILSLAWDYLDLASRRVLQMEIPPAIIACVDGLGFLGFLAIVITNGVVCSDLDESGGVVVLLAYNSVFWIVCWYVPYISLHLIEIESLAKLQQYCTRYHCSPRVPSYHRNGSE